PHLFVHSCGLKSAPRFHCFRAINGHQRLLRCHHFYCLFLKEIWKAQSANGSDSIVLLHWLLTGKIAAITTEFSVQRYAKPFSKTDEK
ncbi:MAG: hypothetical protein ABI977_33675, partial [Acidobacteriota bacterium]